MNKIHLIFISFLIGLIPYSYGQSEFFNGKRIKSDTSANIYLIIDGEKRWINSEFTYNSVFKNYNGIQIVEDNILELIPTGKSIEEIHLYKGSSSEVYLIIDNTRRHISNPEIFNMFYFDWGKIKNISNRKLRKINLGKPIIKNVFVVENPIIDEMPLPCGTRDSDKN